MKRILLPTLMLLWIPMAGQSIYISKSNSTGLIEPQFIGLTSTNFFDGPKAIRLGFNFSRVFTIGNK